MATTSRAMARPKRAVKDKDIGPLVKTVMNRCIQCTRCVRFAAEVAGTPELGGTNRGENMEIGTYVEKALTSELSGNLIDICPVGALTSRPYAFVSRPWELSKTDSIDVLDAVGANIRVDARGPEVLRIIPRVNEAVNEEWMADRGRFSFDGLKRRRLDRPWVKRDGKLVAATWPEAFAAIAAKLSGLPGDRIGAVAGALADAESMLALKDLMAAYGSANLDCRDDFAAIDASRAGLLPLQHDHRRHRRGRRAADHRHRCAARGAGAECAHPQALDGGQVPGRLRRAARRGPDLSGAASGRRAGRDAARSPRR